MRDQVFCLRQGDEAVWLAMVNGHVLHAEWPNKGAALAGMQVEQRRIAYRAVAPSPS